MLKLVLNVKYLSLLSFLTVTSDCDQVLQFGAHSRHYKGCINSKEIIFSDLYYILSDLIFVSAEKSKQTFNTKFIIRSSVQMT